MADPQLAATAKKAEESTSEPTTSQDVVEISPGQDLTVVLKGGNIRLKIEQDVLGKINISGVRTGSLRPTLVWICHSLWVYLLTISCDVG